jgi:putative transposase
MLTTSLFHLALTGNLLFRDDDDFTFFRQTLIDAKIKNNAEIFHYCLMPDCVHLLVRVEKAKDLRAFLKQCQMQYGKYAQKKYAFAGSTFHGLWQFAIAKDSYYLQCGRCIERLPVELEKVMEPWQYRYSSAQFYSLGHRDLVVNKSHFYEQLGSHDSDQQRHYRTFVSLKEPYYCLIEEAWKKGYALSG